MQFYFNNWNKITFLIQQFINLRIWSHLLEKYLMENFHKISRLL